MTSLSCMTQKKAGAYYTPDAVVGSLVRWAVRSESDRMLDPSCGDGRFVATHRNSFGIEQDVAAAHAVIRRAPWALIHEGDFFEWASNTSERFECAAGNPPFIRYQTFRGEVRKRALRLCARLGAGFSGLTSSWAPFLVATASLLRPGGRMAFVVPAEIGHAPYAAPLIEYLLRHFEVVHIVAVREKFFSELSEDCWLLYAGDFGGSTREIRFSVLPAFEEMDAPPHQFTPISAHTWRSVWKRRLRPYLMPPAARELYANVMLERTTKRFGDIARIGIGYVTGANDFFHLRPSDALRWAIPPSLLHPTVRNGRALPPRCLTASTVSRWQQNDDPVMLMRLPRCKEVPTSVRNYLESEAGQLARETYKCRVRDPWYWVPDVQVPDFFLSYMSGLQVGLVRNEARCTCTNSVHCVRPFDHDALKRLLDVWETPFVRLSCELEGHPLGGGMLKLEPGEAARLVVPTHDVISQLPGGVLDEAISILRRWRHYATAP